MKKNIQQHRTKWQLLVILLFCMITNGFAQKQTDILIGEKVPDIRFNHLVNHSTKTAKLSDFAGKLVIIDFWNTGCGPCIKAFPKLDSLQKQFGDKIQIIAVAPESEAVISDFITRMKKTRKINFSFPFEADNLQLRSVFKHVYVPHEVWIGPDGFVKATTDGEYVTAENINKVLNGQASTLLMKTDREFRQVDWSRPLEIKRLGEVIYLNDKTDQDTSFRYISVMTKHIPNISSLGFYPSAQPAAGVRNAGISNMYSMAYGLQTKNRSVPFNRLRFENIDSAMYAPPADRALVNQWMEKYTYCYEINFPDYYHLFPKHTTRSINDAIAKEMGEIMQKDLAVLFGYEAGFEKRKEKCLILSVTDSSKLFTNGGKTKETAAPGFLGISFTNTPVTRVFNSLEYYLRSWILVNETGFTGNIDLELNTKLTDWISVAKELAAHGLLLKEEERWVDLLVIKGKK